MDCKAYDFTLSGIRFIRRGNGCCYRFDMPEEKLDRAIRVNGMRHFRISKREYKTARFAFEVADARRKAEHGQAQA